MKSRNRVIGVLAASLGPIIWGVSFISIKYLVVYLSATIIALFRYTLATMVLFGIDAISKTRCSIDKKDTKKLIVSSLLGLVLVLFCTINSVARIPASIVGIINGGIPIVTLLTDVIIFRRSTTKTMSFAFLLSFLGIGLTVFEGSSMTEGSQFALGTIFMFVGVICWVAYTYMTAPLLDKYSQISVLKWQSLYATIILLPMGLRDIVKLENGLAIFSRPETWGHLLFMGIAASAMAYCLFNIGIQYLGNSTASVFMNFTPITTMIGGYLVFSESLTISKIIGLVLVIISVFMVNKDSKNDEDIRQKDLVS